MIKIVLVALIGVVASMALKRVNSNISFAVTVITGVIIISYLYVDVNNLVEVFNSFSSGFGVSDSHVKLLLKVLGISYVTNFGASVADECGEKFIAQKIEFAGKIFIVSLSVPIFMSLLTTVISLI